MKHKIKNKKKFIRSTSILLFLLLGLFLSFTHSYSDEELHYKTEIILEGDTLWSVAEKQEKTNKYYENKDIRLIVQELKNINQLQDANLEQGKLLKIPTY